MYDCLKSQMINLYMLTALLKYWNSIEFAKKLVITVQELKLKLWERIQQENNKITMYIVNYIKMIRHKVPAKKKSNLVISFYNKKVCIFDNMFSLLVKTGDTEI